jgi:hypothetical protein
MTQPDLNRRPRAADPNQRSAYRETVVEEDDAYPAAASRGIYEERVVAGAGNRQVVRSQQVYTPSEATRRAAVIARAKQIIYFIFGVINVLLVLRFVFLALGASEASPFVNFIYGLSRPFVLPFQGIFGEPTLGDSVLEWASLVGIAIYMLIAYGLARLIELAYAPPRVNE